MDDNGPAGEILVVGFGNPLAGDDGAGPLVAERLARTGALGRRARAVDGGSDSLTLPSLWQGEREIWMVDALVAGAAPGTVRRLDHEQILSIPQLHATAHRLSLPESLRWIALAHPEMASVRYRLWGIEPVSVELLAPMHPAVAAAVEAVAEEIVGAIAAG